MNSSPNTRPRGPSSSLPRNGLSQRGMFSILMLLASILALGFALLGGAKLIFDIFDAGLLKSLNGLGSKILVVSLAYLVGWLTAMVAIRVYGNLVLPFVINFLAWGCLIGVCALYVLILDRLYDQNYDLPHYVAYLLIMAAGLVAMVGLHLIVENHDLRPFSIPLLVIAMIQLGLIVFRYVFTESAKPAFLWKDLLFFFMMSLFAFMMLAHIGLLKPLRAELTNYFDRNSKVIRTDK
jgi:predicted neutral ceramidase superfamily lipid hydrolase